MNVEEARKVLWLKSNPRSLGELLDEGYLTQERLEWASQWAFNYKLKEASKVLLKVLKSSALKDNQLEKVNTEISTDIPIPITVSIEQARVTLWPFYPFKGQPMGKLVASGEISLKDLGYAIENAWNEKIKQAAITFSLVKLEQAIKEPTQSTGHIKVISGGRSFAKKQETLLTLIQGVIFGSILTLVIVFLISTYNKSNITPKENTIVESMNTSSVILAVIFFISIALLLGWLFNYLIEIITKRLDKKIDEYRMGQEGEDQVAQLIGQAFDGSWHVFRNVSIPGRNKSDIDFILVGSPGIWAIEVKKFRGTYRNIGENWELMLKNKWRSAFVNPSKQANNNSLKLKNFLRADNLNVFITPAIIWANPESTLFIENPSVSVWQYNRLLDELGNIWRDEKITNEEKIKIVDKLSKLCERQKLI